MPSNLVNSGQWQLRTVRSSRPHQQWRNRSQENCSAVATAVAVVVVAAAAADEIAGGGNGSEANSAARTVAEDGSTES